MITKQQLERAKAKAQEYWNQFHSDEMEDSIKDAVFSELINKTDTNYNNQILYLNKIWEEIRDGEENKYWGFDAVALEFCKVIERAFNLKHVGII